MGKNFQFAPKQSETFIRGGFYLQKDLEKFHWGLLLFQDNCDGWNLRTDVQLFSSRTRMALLLCTNH